MLEAAYINKKLGEFELKDVSFHLPKGYIMGLVGENGAGKSSLVKVLLGLYKCPGSVIRVNGLAFEKNEEKIRNIIGFVLNEEWFAPALTLMENADYFGQYYREYSKETFLFYCREFELDISRKLRKCSKGENLKFQFAFALSHNPELLIMDEPLANFDPEFREKFVKIITNFRKNGQKSILIATHLIDELEQYADYITYMEKGKVVLSKDIESFLDEYRIVTGDPVAMRYMKKEDIIYRQDGEYSSKALVKFRQGMILDRECKVNRPSLGELMYFLMKGRTGKW